MAFPLRNEAEMVAEIARVVAGAIDKRGFSAAEEGHSHQIDAGQATTPPSCLI